MFIYDIGEGFN